MVFSIGCATALVESADVTEEEASFPSGDVTLHGTVLIPEGDGPHPAIALVHGAGLGLREQYRNVAEALSSAGIVTLIYDKRTEGYSASGVGSRSYSLLADDAIAAVRMLQHRAEVDPTNVGLWGLSEGGWVAPLAATRTDDVAFVITVGAAGMPPAQQSAWSTENGLRHHGVTSPGTIRALVDHAYTFAVSAEMIAEALYDPVPVLEKLEQPLLGIWGTNDRIAAPAESAHIMQQALESGGNLHYVMHFIDNADHDVHLSPDGYMRTGGLAPGYVEAMTSWIARKTSGDLPGPSVDPLPNQARPTPSVTNPQGFARWDVQLGLFAASMIPFAAYFLIASGRWLGRLLGRRDVRPAPKRLRRCAQSVACLGFITLLGTYIYMTFTMVTSGRAVAMIVAGRPAGWLTLQLLAVAMVIVTALWVISWRQARSSVGRGERIRLGALLVGALLFVPWAYWWQLFAV